LSCKWFPDFKRENRHGKQVLSGDNRRAANDRAKNMSQLLAGLAAAGIASSRAVAAELNLRGIKTPQGKTWRQT
jgi:hypothetical protein